MSDLMKGDSKVTLYYLIKNENAYIFPRHFFEQAHF